MFSCCCFLYCFISGLYKLQGEILPFTYTNITYTTRLFPTLKNYKPSMKFENIFQPGHKEMCLMSYANNKGADQPAHPRSLISAFVVRSRDSVMSSFCNQNFNPHASFCSWAGQFASDLVGNSRRHVFSWRGSFVYLGKSLSVMSLKWFYGLLRSDWRLPFLHSNLNFSVLRQCIHWWWW